MLQQQALLVDGPVLNVVITVFDVCCNKDRVCWVACFSSEKDKLIIF
jgi:hypothetical protein